MSDFLAPVVTAAGVSGVLSYLVARTTARSTLASARIGATVEREKSALVSVVITLQDDALESPMATALVEALKRRELERAGNIWSAVGTKLMAGKLA